ncbi:MAG: hypothetical protein ACRD22_11815, partial [Terriglobia bacterium]
GLDAVQTVNEYFSRLRVSHWKDFDPSLPAPSYLGEGAQGDFIEVGKGVVNFHALAKIFLSRGFDGWTMLELDRTREPSVAQSARQMEGYVIENLRLQVYKTQHRPLPGCPQVAMSTNTVTDGSAKSPDFWPVQRDVLRRFSG